MVLNNLSNNIKKRFCRFLIQHSLSAYIENNLQLESLTLDLSKGECTIRDVMLNTKEINELLKNAEIPFRLVKGKVKEITLKLPWKSLFAENSGVEIKGLSVIIEPHEIHIPSPQTSLVDSFYHQIKEMTTSMEIALEEEKEFSETDRFEGMEYVSKGITDILARCKVSLEDVRFRVQCQSVDGMKMGLNILIPSFKFYDQLTLANKNADALSTDQQGFDSSDDEKDILIKGCKNLQMQGLTITFDHSQSSEDSDVDTFHDTFEDIDHSSTSVDSEKGSCHSKAPEAVEIARFYNEQVATIDFNTGADHQSLTLKAECFLGSFCLFLYPREVHLLNNFLNSLFDKRKRETINRPHADNEAAEDDKDVDVFSDHDYKPTTGQNKIIRSVDYRQMQENYYKHLNRTSTTNNPTCSADFASNVASDTEVDQFYSLSMNDSVTYGSGRSGSNASLQRSFTTTGSETLSFDSSHRFSLNDFDNNDAGFSNAATDTNISVTIKIKNAVAVVPHHNVTEVPTMSRNFLASMSEVFDSSDSYNRDDVSRLCDGHDHLSLIVRQLHADVHNKSDIASSELCLSASLNQAELVECLNTDRCAQQPIDPMSNDGRYMYSEIFRVATPPEDTSAQQSLKLKMNMVRRNNELRVGVDVHVATLSSEIDLSIANRLHSLLISDQGNCSATVTSNYQGSRNLLEDKHEILQNKEKTVVSVRFSSPKTSFRVRIPATDLRSPLEMDSSLCRSLRAEYMLLTMHEVVLSTKALFSVNKSSASSPFTNFYVRSRDIELFYADEQGRDPKPFIRIFRKSDDASSGTDNKPPSSPCIKFTVFDHTASKTALINAINDIDFDDKDDLADLHDFSDDEDSKQPGGDQHESSPFSTSRHYYDGKNVVLPGNDHELQLFADKCTSRSNSVLDLQLPNVVISLPSRTFLESLYNRISYDLLLWEPKQPPSAADIIDISNYESCLNVPSKLDLASQSFYQKYNPKNCSPLEGADNQSPACERFRSFSNHSADSADENQIQTAESSGVCAVTVLLWIGNGKISAFSSLNQQLPCDCFDEISILLSEATLLYVSGFGGDPLLDYMSLQIQTLSLYHLQDVPSPSVSEISKDLTLPEHKSPLIHMSDKETTQTMFQKSPYHKNALTLSMKISAETGRLMKNCLVTTVLHGVTYQHVFEPPGTSWVEHLSAFLEIEDAPVPGYVAPSFLTEAHVYAYNCIIEYKPINLEFPQHVVFTISQFWLSSNVVSDSRLFSLQFILENSSLFLSKNKRDKLNLQRHFVKTLETEILDVSFSMLNNLDQMGEESVRKNPFQTLCVNRSQLKFLTCSDSCTALMSLLQYIAANGDSAARETDAASTTYDDAPCPPAAVTLETDKPVINTSSSSKDLANELQVAKEDDAAPSTRHQKHRPSSSRNSKKMAVDPRMMQSVYVPSKRHTDRPNKSKRMYESYPSRLALMDGYNDDEEFTIIDDKDALLDDDVEPIVVYFGQEQKVKIVDNHFRPVVGKRDLLQRPSGYPLPACTYQVQNLSCVWRMFGGKDFDESAKDGKSGRKLDVLLEVHVDKTRFLHDTYEECEKEMSRTVLVVEDFEIRDRLHASQINKFFYRFYNENTAPKQQRAPMFLVKSLIKRPETQGLCECRLRVSVQPIRLNIDQNTLEFIIKFFGELSPASNSATSDQSPQDNVSSVYQETQQQQYEDVAGQPNPGANQPGGLFFEELVFSPEVPIRVDYNPGKGVRNMDQGQSIAYNIVMGVASLNCSQLTLRRISYRRGLLGVERVISFVIDEWVKDIRQNQLPSILGGVGPMHSLVQFVQGIRDLVWMPIEQFRRDGRIICGVQRGSASFGTSTAMATLEIFNGFVSIVQRTAETMYDVVTPSDFGAKNHKHRSHQNRDLQQTIAASLPQKQPEDLREGLHNAVVILRKGVTDTATKVKRAASKEHEHKGLTGAVGSVIRHVPHLVVQPVVFASKATSNVLQGMRNQIVPEAKKEDEDKWRQEDRS